jgi:hypothetical protein
MTKGKHMFEATPDGLFYRLGETAIRLTYDPVSVRAVEGEHLVIVLPSGREARAQRRTLSYGDGVTRWLLDHGVGVDTRHRSKLARYFAEAA